MAFMQTAIVRTQITTLRVRGAHISDNNSLKTGIPIAPVTDPMDADSMVTKGRGKATHSCGNRSRVQ